MNPNKINRALNKLKLEFYELLFTRRFTFPLELSQASKVSNALSAISSRWPDPVLRNDSETPVFILSAGWRSGSTLMQRLVVSSGEVAIWGEPLGDTAFLARLSHSLGCISQDWPPDTFFPSGTSISELSKQWIANLTPEIQYLHSAHRAFFIEWLKKSAQEKFGLDRWGLKEVRLTIDHARYLKWLFPNARFIFVCRNPYHAFRSWKGNKWRSSWPGYNPHSALAFSRHWRLLLEGYIYGSRDVDGILIKHEDLIAGKVDLNELARHIGVKVLDHTVLNRKVGSPQEALTKKQKEISFFDHAIIRHTCNSLMRQLHYS